MLQPHVGGQLREALNPDEVGAGEVLPPRQQRLEALPGEERITHARAAQPVEAQRARDEGGQRVEARSRQVLARPQAVDERQA
ncbi:hypothetical protein FJV41_33895 [Myxococcus llanfairpwllgwyngyllgogerychwyrndrobwllllantysiliogogogochensis]|uniref:Uncharacterized protein n=1 Tax=Myxococcus llanfairpwllgwyngyllgogerychwyrndrobwllllantysiliogogogochensis TaxID=2590453 RepID=A0A540WR71_9BACT|nr:hypothetical protein FJV41_33895 [Myxococcus llanfairpwllgwyngyllgogerychwyrndrobwllllantysiliogogogochensis]